MYELINQAKAIGKGMWKYRWPSVVIAWVVAVVGVIAVFRIPDQYEAAARIYVDTQTIQKPLMSGLTVQPDIDQQVAMLSRTLISRPYSFKRHGNALAPYPSATHRFGGHS